MAHNDFHPVYVDGCFGCKVGSIGYDGKRTSKKTIHPATPESLHAEVTEHRDGRQDVTVKPPAVRLRATTTEER